MAKVWQTTLDRLREDPSYSNLFHMMEQYREDVASEVLLDDGYIMTKNYGDYIRASKTVCGKIQRESGTKEGDVISLIYDTCPDWPILFWGILMSGRIPLLMNPASNDELLEKIMAEAHASAYVSAKEVKDSGRKFIRASGLLSFSSNEEPGEERFAEYVALCTSGTTGSSRLFLYDAKTIAAHILSFDEAKKINPNMPFVEGKECKLLAFLPFHHVFGFSVVYLLYSCTGKTLVYLNNKSAKAIFDTCQKCRVTHFYCVPMFFNLLAGGVEKKLGGKDIGKVSRIFKRMIRSRTLGNSICSMITGGGHIPSKTLEIINGLGYPLCNGFGMTETGIIAVEKSLDASQRIKGSIGFPFSITEWKLQNESGDTGELCIRGDALYSASMIDGKIFPRNREEWFATGDIITRKQDGLYISGRAKDVIINESGENIYPEILEENVSDIEGLKSFCILGVKKSTYEVISLVIEPDGKCSIDEIIGKIKERNTTLPSGEKIAALYISKEPLPISGNMKVKRQALKRTIEEGSSSLDFYDLYSDNVKAVPESEKPEQSSVPRESREYGDILSEVIKKASEHFEKEIKEEDKDKHFIMVLGGNSLQAFSFFTSLESRFNVEFTDSEIASLENCTLVSDFIYSRLHGINISSVPSSAEQGEKTVRITDFAESEEYRSMKKRMEETFKDGYNPYFLPHDSLIRDTSVIDGKEVINLGSYNYLGMSGNPVTKKAAIDAIEKYGTSASGSRTLAGEKTIYKELEKKIAEWKHTDDAIVCTGGWATNLAFVSCFAKKGDFIVYDILSHNSLTEGIKLSEAASKGFEHNNLSQLEEILKRAEGRYSKVLIIVEGVYSMDGDIAPIPEFVRLKKQYGAFLMVDEAHSGCVIGERGGGVDDYFGLEPTDIDIKYGTLSKGLGACGGFIASSKELIEYLRYQMNGFVFTAGIAPPLAAEVMAAIDLIMKDSSEVSKLHENIAYFVRRATEEGMNIGLAGKSAIVPVLIGDDAKAAEISKKLIDCGVFVPPAMYPAVPLGESRLRFTISSTHSEEQLEKAISLTAKVLREEGILK